MRLLFSQYRQHFPCSFRTRTHRMRSSTRGKSNLAKASPCFLAVSRDIFYLLGACARAAADLHMRHIAYSALLAHAAPSVSSSSVARQTAAGVGHHNLTYGEVRPTSIDEHVCSAIDWRADDVFYDLGSGTGKIPLQVAVYTSVARSVGIEFAEARHVIAMNAIARVRGVAEGKFAVSDSSSSSTHGSSSSSSSGSSPTADRGSPSRPQADPTLRSALNRLVLRQGDFLEPGAMDDATVIFINNTVFEPSLMIALVERLSQLPKLRKLVVLRKLCERHSPRCRTMQGPCSAFSHPPTEARCKVRMLTSRSHLMQLLLLLFVAHGGIRCFSFRTALWCSPRGATRRLFSRTTGPRARRTYSPPPPCRLLQLSLLVALLPLPLLLRHRCKSTPAVAGAAPPPPPQRLRGLKHPALQSLPPPPLLPPRLLLAFDNLPAHLPGHWRGQVCRPMFDSRAPLPRLFAC